MYVSLFLSYISIYFFTSVSLIHLYLFFLPLSLSRVSLCLSLYHYLSFLVVLLGSSLSGPLSFSLFSPFMCISFFYLSKYFYIFLYICLFLPPHLWFLFASLSLFFSLFYP
uniref:Uncharacterized protein n=1 Tax=Arundo donax TaxID=35708 RepID=A0A0A8Y122_ARUDO